MKATSLVFLFILFASKAFGQTEPSISVSGEVTKKLTITVNGMKDFPMKEVKAKDKDGKEHVFKGTLVASVLNAAGVTLGKDLRGANLVKYVTIKAVDGYQVVYSLAEIDPEFSSGDILLATHVDGKLLPEGEGPFRIIVPNDKRPTRWVRQATEIKVAFAKD